VGSMQQGGKLTPDSGLKGKTAWVTGAASGIGKAVVDRFTASGALVAGLDLDADGLEELFGNDNQRFVTVDIRDAASVSDAVAALIDGIGPPDILVNSAGISASASMVEHDVTVWTDVLATNLTGSFNLARLVFGGMCERGFGRIVNISAGSGFRVGRGHAAYGASKAGLVALTKSMAMEGAAFGVTANAVAPGLVDTRMTRARFPTDEDMQNAAASSPVANPMGRPLLAEDIAHAVWFLSLPQSAAITGQTIHVNNGSLML
jgi:NAD(P)-dependent dehydrogenase (short-subunit alcohol dehydrogenase family)